MKKAILTSILGLIIACGLSKEAQGQESIADTPPLPEPSAVTVRLQRSESPPPPEPTPVKIRLNRSEPPAPPEPKVVVVHLQRSEPPALPEPRVVVVHLQRSEQPEPPSPVAATLRLERYDPPPAPEPRPVIVRLQRSEPPLPPEAMPVTVHLERAESPPQPEPTAVVVHLERSESPDRPAPVAVTVRLERSEPPAPPVPTTVTVRLERAEPPHPPPPSLVVIALEREADTEADLAELRRLEAEAEIVAEGAAEAASHLADRFGSISSAVSEIANRLVALQDRRDSGETEAPRSFLDDMERMRRLAADHATAASARADSICGRVERALSAGSATPEGLLVELQRGRDEVETRANSAADASAAAARNSEDLGALDDPTSGSESLKREIEELSDRSREQETEIQSAGASLDELAKHARRLDEIDTEAAEIAEPILETLSISSMQAPEIDGVRTQVQQIRERIGDRSESVFRSDGRLTIERDRLTEAVAALVGSLEDLEYPERPRLRLDPSIREQAQRSAAATEGHALEASAAVDRVDRCLLRLREAENRSEPQESSGGPAPGWDMSGGTTDLDEHPADASGSPEPPVDLASAAASFGSSLRACDYSGALAAVALIQRADPGNPWLTENREAITQLEALARLNLPVELARADRALAAGDYAGWATIVAPFIQAGCRTPALQGHLADAQRAEVGRENDRSRELAEAVARGHSKSKNRAGAVAEGLTRILGSSRDVGRSPRSGTTTGTAGGASGSGAETPGQGSDTSNPGSPNRQCIATDPGEGTPGRHWVLVEEDLVGTQKGYRLVPHNPSLENYRPPFGRVIGRYTRYSAARTALGRKCPS